jgi:hypothetical protein
MIKRHIRGGGQYLIAYVKKIISSANRAQRIEYSKEYLYKPLFSF